MATARPSREDVLAWMREHQAGQKSAAKHFGIPVGTIKTWLHRARLAAAKPDPPDQPETPRTPGDGERSNLPSAGRTPTSRDSRPSETASQALGDIADMLADAARVRAEHLATAPSIGRGEKDTAIALGIIVDKLKIIREMDSGARPGSGAKGGEDAARRVLRALGGSGPDDSR